MRCIFEGSSDQQVAQVLCSFVGDKGWVCKNVTKTWVILQDMEVPKYNVFDAQIVGVVSDGQDWAVILISLGCRGERLLSGFVRSSLKCGVVYFTWIVSGIEILFHVVGFCLEVAGFTADSAETKELGIWYAFSGRFWMARAKEEVRVGVCGFVEYVGV